MMFFGKLFVRLAAILLLAVVLLDGLEYRGAPKPTTPSPTPPAPESTAVNIPISTSTAITTTPVVGATSTPGTSTKTPKSTTPKKQTPATTSAETLKLSLTNAANSLLTASDAPQISTEDLNIITRKAVVNILCLIQGDTTRAITGSGIFIDPRGVILTNAHIAQYFLLKDYPKPNSVNCLIRTGSPASPSYKANLLYLSPSWLSENKKDIIEESPTGTGENDFALLLISDTANSVPLPASFPYITLNTSELDEKTSLQDDYLIAGYPAGFLGGSEVIKNLFIVSAVTTIKNVYTFKANTVDLISLGGTVLAQKGASGSGVVRKSDQKLIAIVVTTTEAATTEDRDLRAITTTHINRVLSEEVGRNLKEFLNSNVFDTQKNFQNELFPALKQLLVSVIESK